MGSVRESVAGPESGPEPPFPIRVNGKIVRGFGRGSRELGIPTANIPITGLDIGGHKDIESGVYYGWAGLSLNHSVSDAALAAGPMGSQEESRPVAGEGGTDNATAKLSATNDSSLKGTYPMVMSIGWNPFYKNEVRSVEVHIIHKFHNDFYNAMLNLAILGFIRPERNYDSMQALIDDINFDIEVAQKSLLRPAYADHVEDPYLLDFRWGAGSNL